jgi:arylsulfatase A-like enzyme
MSADFGYSRGFDVFDDRATTIEDGARRIVEQVRQGADEDRPLFAFLHTYEIHSPYDPPPEYRSMWGEFPSRFEASSKNLRAINTGRLDANESDRRFVTAMYDAGIRYTDNILRVMFAELESLGFFENHIVVITSDHGEELGERGAYLHRRLLYDDLIRVPLILRGTRVPAGTVRPELVSSVDIAPTLLAYAGIDVTARMEGRDLLSGESSVNDAIFAQYKSLRYAIRTRDWKMIVSTRPAGAELYDLRADPQERENVFTRHPDTARALELRLREWRNALPRLPTPEDAPSMDITDEQIERLRELGYVE